MIKKNADIDGDDEDNNDYGHGDDDDGDIYDDGDDGRDDDGR